MAEKFRKFASAAAAMAVTLSRPNYFESGKKGELVELRADLCSDVALLKKEAMKKVIAGMTIGKDVSPLFAEVLMCIQTEDLELKKLVYLYLMNYAKTQPELALLAINTFIKDSEDINPLIRALSIRTMGCIRIERILDYVIEPLRRGIKDSSPYVRKTSALCIAKIFDLNAEVSEDCGFLEALQELLMTDSNPMVVSNVVAALSDIQELCPDLEALNLNDEIVSRLIGILSDCTEWGQVFIMDSLSDFDGKDINEIEKLLETVIPKLQHANQAVVMSSINLLVKQGLESRILPENHQLKTVIMRKLSSPLISILSPPNPPELQYAALRNVNILVQSYPKIFGNEINVFFCSYNDPQYVKLEKLEIIGKIVEESSVNRIVSELCEYAKDVDGEIVKTAIKILSQCALKSPRWSGRICEIFMELLETQLPIVLQQVTINLISLFRNESTKIEFISLLECFYFVNPNETWNGLYGNIFSQTSFIWILGEFCNPKNLETEKLDEILGLFEEISEAESFKLEGVEFQSELVLASLKIFIINEKNCETLLRNILRRGIEEGESVDLRDRCKIYERILNHEIGRIRKNVGKVVDNKKSDNLNCITGTTNITVDDWGNDLTNNTSVVDYEPVLEGLVTDFVPDYEDDHTDVSSWNSVKILLNQLTKLSSIYHQLPSEFVSSRSIMKDCSESGHSMSPIEQSIKSLSFENTTTKATEGYAGDMPRAWTKLLRHSRPAVANLLDLTSTSESKRMAETLKENLSSSPKTPKEKYANLLDLLD